MNDVPPVDAQETIRQLLTGMEIYKVISIDDLYATTDSYYENAVILFEKARGNPAVEYSTVIPKHVLDAPDNVWTRLLQIFWSEIEPDERMMILSELAQATDYQEVSGDVRDLSLLKSLIPDDLFIALSPDDWDQKRESIFLEVDADHKVLCLFDQDLSMVSRSANAGVTLLQQVLAQDTDGRVICGLLTQTLRREDETSKARDFSAEFGLSLDQYLPLSKDRLRGDPMEFADGLKMTILNYAREQLSKQVKDLAEQANAEALTQINDIDVYDFEHIVIQSSQKEGVWEPDTLFRLFDLFRYNAFRTKALANEQRTSIYDSIQRVRSIHNIRTIESPHQPPSIEVYEIRHIELFDEAPLLNQAHQPLDLGDIFKVGSDQYYILLTQPCDLMIRDDSSSQSNRKKQLANLVRIRTLEKNEDAPSEISSFRLDHFEPGKRTFVKFSSPLQISLNVLDLSVFNANGKCRISLPESKNLSYSTLHNPWRERFERLENYYHTAQRNFTNGSYHKASDYQKKALRYLLCCSNKDISLHYDENGVFEFDICRVARLRNPLSVHLLGAYYSYLSRNPQEHDFAKSNVVE